MLRGVIYEKNIIVWNIGSFCGSDRLHAGNVGGQFPGCSTALLLAEKGKKVTIMEEFNYFGMLKIFECAACSKCTWHYSTKLDIWTCRDCGFISVKDFIPLEPINSSILKSVLKR